jgi:hypothetical protein
MRASTGVAALPEGRTFLGVEVAREYTRNASDRLGAAESQVQLAEVSHAVGAAAGSGEREPPPNAPASNVQRRIADTIQRIMEQHAALGQHLSSAVRTGAYLSDLPERARR